MAPLKRLLVGVAIVTVLFSCVAGSQQELCYHNIETREIADACEAVAVMSPFGGRPDSADDAKGFFNFYLNLCVIETIDKSKCREKSNILPDWKIGTN